MQRLKLALPQVGFQRVDTLRQLARLIGRLLVVRNFRQNFVKQLCEDYQIETYFIILMWVICPNLKDESLTKD